MKKKLVSVLMTAAVTASLLAGCGSTSSSTASTAAPAASEAASAETASTEAASASTEASTDASADGALTYKSIELGKTGTDVTAEIHLLTHRTDMLEADYNGTTWDQYIAEFNKVYPNITVDVEGITDYATDSLTRLQAGSWGDIMMIPAVDKSELPNYFISFGSSDEVADEVNFSTNWQYDGQTYGIPSTGNAQGIVYNKKIFKDAGITKLPTTPEEFIDDLKAIKEKTKAIPLYTNYAAGWTLGAWDAYISGTATGDSTYMNQKLLHTKDPFKDYKDDTHAYAVYKVLYDAVSDKLTEDDYTTTDWEGCKGMINNGEIGCMVLGSWAVSQMQAAGDNAADIGYMPFPITVDGKQYASAGPDYNFGIAADTDATQQEASMIFVKWFTEESGFSYNESGLPISKNAKTPALYDDFANVTYVSDDPAVAGEEDILNTLNSASELNVNNGGNDKVMKIVEKAADGSESYDDIMAEWNTAWDKAQTDNKVSQDY